jgi:ribosomal RNA-processing protein 9
MRAPASQGGGHAGDALSVAVSADGRLLASGGRDGLVRVWDVRERRQVQSFRRHRGAVTGVVFRRGSSSDLYSISADRTVNVWNLEQMAYVETLFGHAAEVLSADALGAQRLITSGADCSVRIWKIPEQTQLLYKGHSASIDAVAFVSDDAFVTGSQDGAVALWSARKKKPMDLVANAHGGKWICSVAAARYGDVAASGASDGALRLWVLEKGGALAPLSSVELAGFVNGMVFSSDSRFLVAAVGQEHRLGRWSRVAEARNSVCIVRLHDAAAE